MNARRRSLWPVLVVCLMVASAEGVPKSTKQHTSVGDDNAANFLHPTPLSTGAEPAAARRLHVEAPQQPAGRAPPPAPTVHLPIPSAGTPVRAHAPAPARAVVAGRPGGGDTRHAAQSRLLQPARQVARYAYNPRIVPGQAFHDRRSATIAANYSNAPPGKWTMILGARDLASAEQHSAVALDHATLQGDARFFVRRRNVGVTFATSSLPGTNSSASTSSIGDSSRGDGSSGTSGSGGSGGSDVGSGRSGSSSGVLLEAGGRPFLVAGFNAPDAVMMAAGGDGEGGTRQRVRELLTTAQQLGLNVMRTWAFTEGSGPARASPVLQPYPGVLEEQAMRDGLDWLVAEARKYDIRLLLSLVDGSSSAAHGGMMQYCEWVDPMLTVTDFYTNDTVKSVFLDYVGAVLTRKNSHTGIVYRNDPTIFGWELAHAPRDPGHPGSSALEGWVRQMASYVRQKDPNHLISVGFEGFFGLTSPHLLQHNPMAQLLAPPLVQDTYLPYDAVCEGADFFTQQNMVVLDLAVLQLYPDKWLACSAACKLAWAERWVGAHLKDAVRMQKPLLLSAFGAQRPHGWRNNLTALVYKEVARAAANGHPMAGSMLWSLGDPQQLDTDGFLVTSNTTTINALRPLPHAGTQEAAAAAEQWERRRRRFYNSDEMAACLLERARGRHYDGIRKGDPGWISGWQQTHALIRNATRGAARLRGRQQQEGHQNVPVA